jgi:hypothetical protein
MPGKVTLGSSLVASSCKFPVQYHLFTFAGFAFVFAFSSEFVILLRNEGVHSGWYTLVHKTQHKRTRFTEGKGVYYCIPFPFKHVLTGCSAP